MGSSTSICFDTPADSCAVRASDPHPSSHGSPALLQQPMSSFVRRVTNCGLTKLGDNDEQQASPLAVSESRFIDVQRHHSDSAHSSWSSAATTGLISPKSQKNTATLRTNGEIGTACAQRDDLLSGGAKRSQSPLKMHFDGDGIEMPCRSSLSTVDSSAVAFSRADLQRVRLPVMVSIDQQAPSYVQAAPRGVCDVVASHSCTLSEEMPHAMILPLKHFTVRSGLRDVRAPLGLAGSTTSDTTARSHYSHGLPFSSCSTLSNVDPQLAPTLWQSWTSSEIRRAHPDRSLSMPAAVPDRNGCGRYHDNERISEGVL